MKKLFVVFIMISFVCIYCGFFIDQAIAKYPEKVQEYKGGKKGLIGLFIGEVMKLSKGKADPKVCTQLLREKLEN